GLAARLYTARHVFPLAFCLVDINHIHAQVECARQQMIATSLAFCRQDASIRDFALIGWIGVRTEGEQRGIQIGLPQTAIDHSSAAEFRYGSSRGRRANSHWHTSGSCQKRASGHSIHAVMIAPARVAYRTTTSRILVQS